MQFHPHRKTLNASQVYRNIYHNMLLSLRYLRGKNIQVNTSFHSPIEWEEALTKPKHIVLFSIHQGPFEALHPILADLRQRPVLVPVASSHPVLNSLRSSKGSQLFTGKQFKALLQAADKEPSILTLLIDQSPKKATFTGNILGHTSPLWPELILHFHKQKASLFPFEIQNIKGNLHLQIGAQIHCKDSLELQAKIFTQVENWILKKPEDFIWHYPKHWPKIP